jgi:hypothetical protein
LGSGQDSQDSTVVGLNFQVDISQLDKRFARLPLEVRQKVAIASMRKVLGDGAKMVRPNYPRSMRIGFHLQDYLFAKVKNYKYAVWAAIGVRVSGGSRETALPGWRFHFTERDRRSRAGTGRGDTRRLRVRSDGGIRAGGVDAGKIIKGRHQLPGLYMQVSTRIMPEMRRRIAKVLK